MFNISQIKYSIIHNKAIVMLAKKYGFDKINGFLEQLEYHDMDKALGYLVDSPRTVYKKHIFNSSHHLESQILKSDNDLYEAIFDWESARYTKKDKPLNAYQTLKKYYPQYLEVILPLLEKLDLNHDYTPIDQQIVDEIGKIEISNEEVLNVVTNYINYLILNHIGIYLDLDEIVVKIYSCLNKSEQQYFKEHLDHTLMDYILSKKRKLNIGVFCHKGCDYDAVCSVMALTEYIKSLTSSEQISVIPIIEYNQLFSQINFNQEIYSCDSNVDCLLDYAIICDVNEQDRVYGLEFINQVDVDKRYIIDHHDKNREELEVLETNKLILPSYSSTCEIIADLLIRDGFEITLNIAKFLYLGIASDTSGFERSVTENTQRIVNLLPVNNEEKDFILNHVTKMSPEQEMLYHKIKDLPSYGQLKIYTLLEPIEAGDITKYLKHKMFDQLTGPTEENPVTCFIIGCGNNYFIKLKKLPNYDLNILDIATNCNGGGHENRCAGRFYNTDFETVFNKILEEYRKVKVEDEDVHIKKISKYEEVI